MDARPAPAGAGIPPVTMVAPTPFVTEGGCSYRVLGEARGLLRRGVPLTLHAYPSGRDLSDLPVHRPYRSSRPMGIGLNPIRPFYDAALLFSLLGRSSPRRLLHVHLHEGGQMGAVLRRLGNGPYLLDLQGSFQEEIARTFPGLTSSGRPGFLERWERRLERDAAHVVVSSLGLFERLRALGHVPAPRLHLLEDGVDLSRFPPLSDPEREARRTQWRRARGLPPDAIVATYVGGLSPEQGIDDLLAAAPQLLREHPSLVLVFHGIVAQGADPERYRNLARPLGGRVRFEGLLTFENLPGAMQAADVGLTWKKSTLEGNGKVPVYMAAGLPVVALRTPANVRYLGEGSDLGGLVAADVPSAREALGRLLGDPALRSAMGRAARRAAELHWSWDQKVEALLPLYRELSESLPRETGG